MSLNRLCQLAGLHESIADTPEINQEIERRLDKFPETIRTSVLDALENLKDAGEKGLRVPEWAKKVRLNAYRDQNNPVNEILRLAAKQFPFVVTRVAPGYYKWQVHKVWSATSVDDIDPSVKTAITGQVELTNKAFEWMRAMGHFTEQELKTRLYSNRRIPRPVIDMFVNHLLEHFSEMLTKTGDIYTLKTDKINTRKNNMQLFRRLSNPKKS